MKRITLVLGVLLMIMAGIALVLSCMSLLQSYEDYQKGTDTYEEMSHSYIQQPDKEKEERKDSSETQKSNESKETAQENLQIDFEGLQEVNPEIIGWIEIPGICKMYMGNEGHLLVMEFYNSYVLPLIKERERYISTKRNSENHGIGLHTVV